MNYISAISSHWQTFNLISNPANIALNTTYNIFNDDDTCQLSWKKSSQEQNKNHVNAPRSVLLFFQYRSIYDAWFVNFILIYFCLNHENQLSVFQHKVQFPVSWFLLYVCLQSALQYQLQFWKSTWQQTCVIHW